MISWPLVVVTFHGYNRRTVNCLKRCYSQSPSELIGWINNMQWTIPSFLGYNPNMHISFVSFQCKDNIPKYQQNWENNLTLYIIYNQASFLTFMKFLWKSSLSRATVWHTEPGTAGIRGTGKEAEDFPFSFQKYAVSQCFFKKNNENLSIRNHRRNIFVCKLFGHSHWLNMSNLFPPHSSHTDPPSCYIPDKEYFFYNVLISDCLQHLIVLSQLVQLLINILYIWKSFLYHCLLTRGIITHSVIKQSAKTWPCALSAKNHGISRRLNVVDIMIVTFFYIIRVL